MLAGEAGKVIVQAIRQVDDDFDERLALVGLLVVFVVGEAIDLLGTNDDEEVNREG